MQIYTEKISIRISSIQKKTLDKLKGYKVNTNQFIRNAIKEKIDRKHKEIISKFEDKNNYCPF